MKVTDLDIERIAKALPNFSRIRNLNLVSSFLNNDLKFLSKHNLKLTSLELGQVILGPGVLL